MRSAATQAPEDSGLGGLQLVSLLASSVIAPASENLSSLGESKVFQQRVQGDHKSE